MSNSTLCHPELITITIDGKEWQVPKGRNLLQCILDAQQTIPHFCYHEALGAVGSCRLCAAMVAPAADKPQSLQMTCMMAAQPGMVIQVQADYAQKFRKGVIEGLMLNHPHDCPVCDEGGECMLQDMTVLSEHQHRRNRFNKRTWENQYLGPLIHHEMNRCITCYRCVRFYRDYAKGDDFGVFGSRDRVYFGRFEEGVLESEFSGNLLDVCPTGVFTNKRFRESYVRPWDLSTAKSVCVNCSVGCNVLPGFRHETLRRIKPLENPSVNRWFMCDKGRFGGEFVNHESRLKAGFVDGRVVPASEARQILAVRIKDVRNRGGKIVGIGSPRASLEANAALALLVGEAGGQTIFFSSDAKRQVVRRAAGLTVSGHVRTPSLQDIEKSDCVVILGGDVTGEAPMLDLSARQAVNGGGRVFIASPRAGKLDVHSTLSIRTVPGYEAQLVDTLLRSIQGEQLQLNGESNFVQEAAYFLKQASRPVLLVSARTESLALVNSAFALAMNLHSDARPCSLAYWYDDVNSAGVGLARHDAVPSEVIADLRAGRVQAVVALETDLVEFFGSSEQLAGSLQACELVATIDAFLSPGTQASSVVVPCVSHYQAFGTLVNYEGRAQRYEGLHIPGPISSTSSEVLMHVMNELGTLERVHGTEFHDVYDIARDQSSELDNLLAGGVGVCLCSDSPVSGDVQLSSNIRPFGSELLVGWQVVHTFGSDTLGRMSPPSVELGPGPYVELHPSDADRLGFSEGTLVTVSTTIGEFHGPLRLRSDLHSGVACSPKLASIMTQAPAAPLSDSNPQNPGDPPEYDPLDSGAAEQEDPHSAELGPAADGPNDPEDPTVSSELGGESRAVSEALAPQFPEFHSEIPTPGSPVTQSSQATDNPTAKSRNKPKSKGKR
jgi:NADH-quinone oxidoreductase subunit G